MKILIRIRISIGFSVQMSRLFIFILTRKMLWSLNENEICSVSFNNVPSFIHHSRPTRLWFVSEASISEITYEIIIKTTNNKESLLHWKQIHIREWKKKTIFRSGFHGKLCINFIKNMTLPRQNLHVVYFVHKNSYHFGSWMLK